MSEMAEIVTHAAFYAGWPNATHCDLYDQKDKIPLDKIEEFLKKNLK